MRQLEGAWWGAYDASHHRAYDWGPRPGEDGPMKPTLDLNADLGEEVTDDVALLEVVTSANVACGGHAGTPELMRVVCAGAAERGVAIGAPGRSGSSEARR